jgi:hypothetical protein
MHWFRKQSRSDTCHRGTTKYAYRSAITFSSTRAMHAYIVIIPWQILVRLLDDARQTAVKVLPLPCTAATPTLQARSDLKMQPRRATAVVAAAAV